VSGYDRKKLAEELGVDYVTVCRWANGSSCSTRHEIAQRLTDLWMRLIREGHVTDDVSEEYVVGEGESLDVTGAGHIRIYNYGVLRINVHHHHPADAE